MYEIAKMLSPNDTGETGAHQAGMLIPKDAAVLSFFPKLDPTTLNPRVHLVFQDDFGERWTFAFIYYNGALFGRTRNEYRLTRMTQYIRRNTLRAGDTIFLRRSDQGAYCIQHSRMNPLTSGGNPQVLRLGSSWKAISF